MTGSIQSSDSRALDSDERGGLEALHTMVGGLKLQWSSSNDDVERGSFWSKNFEQPVL